MNTQQIERTIGGLAGLLCTGLLLAAMSAGVTAAAQPAQGPPREGREGPRGGPGGGRGPFGRAGMNLPGLTDAQREQMRGVTERHRDEIGRLAEQVRTAQRALQATVAQGQVDEGKAADLGAATGALALARARAQAEVFAILTPEQRQQIETRREEMQKWMASRPGGAARGAGRPGGPSGRRGR